MSSALPEPAFSCAITEETSRACLEQFGSKVAALVLTGSLARGEASVIQEDGKRSLLSDAEFILVLKDTVALPRESKVNSLITKIVEALRSRKVDCSVSLGVAHSEYFRQMKPSIFAYEMRALGKVIEGNAAILQLIPEFASSEIPREDAWRLLSNRMIEQIEGAISLSRDSVSLPSDVFYKIVKLYLDMGTSLLVFMGEYEPSYRERAQRLMEIAVCKTNVLKLPFSLSEFAQIVEKSTRWKLNPSLTLGDRSWDYWTTAVKHATQLWKWELTQLTGSQQGLSADHLMTVWMKRQPLVHRWRGWFYILRKQGFLRSRRYWWEWGRKAIHASPRYLVYAAAGKVFPCLSQCGCGAREVGPDLDFSAIAKMLPSQSYKGEGDTWREVAREISRNYHQYLEDTRA